MTYKVGTVGEFMRWSKRVVSAFAIGKESTACSLFVGLKTSLRPRTEAGNQVLDIARQVLHARHRAGPRWKSAQSFVTKP